LKKCLKNGIILEIIQLDKLEFGGLMCLEQYVIRRMK